MSLVTLVPLTAYAGVVLGALRRSRVFGIFAIVVLGFPTLATVMLRDAMGGLTWAALFLQLASCVHFAALVLRPAMRPTWFRLGVSIPGLYFTACSFLALPWSVAAATGSAAWGWWIPFGLGAVGVLQSMRNREEEVDITLDGTDAGALGRYRQGYRRPESDQRPLSIVQITDPHLGPFMSVPRLRKICERAVERDPDLILVTGDLMTMESHDVEIVSEAIAPLARARGRVFACHGNHDHEAREVVAEAYRRAGVRLLVDEEAIVPTASGPVQLIGADFVWRGRDAHLAALAKRYPRRAGATRLWLLHDPGAFKHIPPTQADLVLSGHTHGGQVGLLSVGSPATFLSLVSKIPDHGLWARGTDRLYVHRAQGLYGFPIRLGVPGEESLLRVHHPMTRASATRER